MFTKKELLDWLCRKCVDLEVCGGERCQPKLAIEEALQIRDDLEDDLK